MSQSSPYFFVTPSDPDGDRFAYSKEGSGHPAPVFVQASWEWLLERAVRRRVLLSLSGGDLAPLQLSERRGMYRVPRLLCRPCTAGAPGEADFPAASAESYLPDLGASWSPPGYCREKTAHFPSDVPGLVGGVLSLGGADGDAGSAPDFWFIDPSAWPSELSKDASYRVSTESSTPTHPSGVPGVRETRTSVVNSPFRPASFLPVFRVLGDVRVDDVDSVSVPVWDPASGRFADRRMYCPRVRFPRSFDADPDHGELVAADVLHDWGAADGRDPETKSVLVLHGLTGLSAGFAVGCRVDADLGVYEGSGPAWARRDQAGAEGACLRDSMASYVGYLREAPAPSRGGLGFVSPPRFTGRVHPVPDWGGKASCWEKWGIPDLSAERAGSVVRRQLEAACSARPCLPPPPAELPSEDDGADAPYSRVHPLAPDGGSARPPCASAPVNAALVLDRLLATVHPVDRLYCVVDASSTLSSETWEVHADTAADGTVTEGTARESNEVERTVRGKLVAPLADVVGRVGGGFYGLGMGDPDGSNSFRHRYEYAYVDTRTSPQLGGGSSDERTGTERTAASASLSGLVALRPSSARVDGLVTRDRRQRVYEASGDYFSAGGATVRDDSSDCDERGEESDYVPDDSDLLFHPDVMAWMERAELFAVVRAVAYAAGGGTSEYVSALDTSGGDAARTETLSESGSRTSRARFRVVSLGEMNLSTGEFPDLDLARFVMDCVPHGGGVGFLHPDNDDNTPSEWNSSSDELYSAAYSPSGTAATDTVETETPERYDLRFDLCRTYLAVKWRFDTESPPEPSGGGSGAARRWTALDAALRAAARELAGADAGASRAGSRVSSLGARLDALDAVLSGGVPAREAEVARARAALDAAEAVRDDARDALDGAQGALDAAEASVPGDDSDPDALDAALSAVLSAQAALRSAKADLADAEADVLELSCELSAMEANASADLAAAQDAVAAARSALADAESALGGASGLRDAADGAVSAARSALAGVSAASDVSAALASAASSVEAAKSSVRAYSDAVGEARDAVAAAETACAHAFAAVWGA